MNTAGTPVSAEVAAQAEAGGVRLVAVDQLSPNPHQPRTLFDETALQELADSIRTHGIIQPLVVTADHSRDGAYWLVAGERRWRAARLAGVADVPVIVREASPQQLMEWALVENVQRADLNPLEEATAYVALMEEFGLTQAQVAERVGKSRSAVANSTRLLNLPLDAQQAVTDGRISAGHARTLLALPDHASMTRALGEILRRDLNVRQTEALVKRLAEVEPETAPPAPVDPRLQAHLTHMESRFRAAFGTRVSLSRNQDGSGRLIVHFFSDDDLDALYRLVAGEDE
jgi:ParB family chromosome partitioning protein